MIDTFFFVEVQGGGHTIRYGPYLHFENAAGILMDTLPILLAVDHPEILKTEFSTSISEYGINNNIWQLINIKVCEHRDL